MGFAARPQMPALSPAPWLSLQGTEFENYLHSVFTSLGYRVTTTKAHGDQGVDFVIEGRSRRIAVQAKGASAQGVPHSAVQAAYTGKAVFGCDACAIITNGHFTPAAQEVANAVFCTLIDCARLPELTAGNIYPPCDDPRVGLPTASVARPDLPQRTEKRPEKERSSRQRSRVGMGCGCVVGIVCIAGIVLGAFAVCSWMGIDLRDLATRYGQQAIAKVTATGPEEPKTAADKPPPGAGPGLQPSRRSADPVVNPPVQVPDERPAEDPAEAAERLKREAEIKARIEAEEREKAAKAEQQAEQRASARLKLIRQLIEDRKIDTAKFRLEKLIEDYPKTKAAEEARQLLKRL
jgi:restriction system protein